MSITSVFRPGLFAGKTAIVTGGGTGIGKAIAEELLHLGCRVMVASRKLDRLKESVLSMRKDQPSAVLEYMECNIRKPEQVKSLVQTTLEKFGKIDYLVNNAGGQFPGAAETFTLKGWNAVIETNLTGTFFVTQEVYNGWMIDNGGVIVNIIADMWKGFPGMSHTGAARAGVDNLTKSLSVEWAPQGVRINSVAPGPTFSQTAESNYSMDVFKIIAPSVPAKRVAQVPEVSASVCFLLSPAAAFITGETVKVDGGHSLYSTSGFWEVPDHDKLPAYTWEKDLKEQKRKEEEDPGTKSKL